MEIGAKLRKARTDAGLSQEKAAEALGVSRQTVSNWENEKTYPDIVSVVRMSDLYAVSLDHLLKEESTVQQQPAKQTYLDYLEESTNVVKSKKRQTSVILIVAYLVIWVFSNLFFWLGTEPDDAMGYGLIFVWLLMPITTFVIALLMGKTDAFGKWKWLFVLFFGVMFMLVPYSTYSVANMLAFHVFRWPDFPALPIGAAIGAAGLGLGTLLRRRQMKKAAPPTDDAAGKEPAE
ncbi:MAG: helix-turn-helix domain-containing protein [Clostridia bacterium]|nr:helix-turn-helix domain-containing protein [Clostridia bacterium]